MARNLATVSWVIRGVVVTNLLIAAAILLPPFSEGINRALLGSYLEAGLVAWQVASTVGLPILLLSEAIQRAARTTSKESALPLVIDTVAVLVWLVTITVVLARHTMVF